MTVAVLVNSANPTGYSTTPEHQANFNAIQLYLDHLQVPYEVIDTATTPPPADLGNRQLILGGHTGLNLSSDWQNAIVNAVNGGTGFVNLDAEPTIGAQTHIQALFGATGSSTGTPATSLSIPAAVLPGGDTPHFITALQRKFLGDPAGDIVSPSIRMCTCRSQTATVLTTGQDGARARLGTNPLIVAQQTPRAAVHFGSYLYCRPILWFARRGRFIPAVWCGQRVNLSCCAAIPAGQCKWWILTPGRNPSKDMHNPR